MKKELLEKELIKVIGGAADISFDVRTRKGFLQLCRKVYKDKRDRLIKAGLIERESAKKNLEKIVDTLIRAGKIRNFDITREEIINV